MNLSNPNHTLAEACLTQWRKQLETPAEMAGQDLTPTEELA